MSNERASTGSIQSRQYLLHEPAAGSLRRLVRCLPLVIRHLDVHVGSFNQHFYHGRVTPVKEVALVISPSFPVVFNRYQKRRGAIFIPLVHVNPVAPE